MIADERCPECHGTPETLLVTPTKLRKRCTSCGHKWSEERKQDLMPRKGYVDIHSV